MPKALKEKSSDPTIPLKDEIEKKVLTTDEVASYTGHTKSYIYKLCNERKIPHYKSATGRRTFFCLQEIIEWCTSNRVQTISDIINPLKLQS